MQSLEQFYADQVYVSQNFRIVDQRINQFLPGTDRNDREDLRQIIFMHAWKGLPAFRGDSKVPTWLYRIATNVMITHLSRTRPLFVSLDSDSVRGESLIRLYLPANQCQRLERAQINQCIEDAQLKLSSGHSIVWKMRSDGIPYADIAKVTGRSQSTDRAMVFQAKELIKAALRRKGMVQ